MAAASRCSRANGWVDLAGQQELGLTVYKASFGGGVIRVPCNPLILAGGIDAVDIVNPVILPPGTALDYEVTIAGQTFAMAEVTGTHPLTGAVESLPLNALLTFTDALAPIFSLAGVGAGSYCRLSKAGTSLVYVSATRSPSVPVTQIQETVTVDNWTGASNTLTARLLTGAGFATETAPTSIQDEMLDAKTLRRTFYWLLGTAVSDHRVRLNGATTDQTKNLQHPAAGFLGQGLIRLGRTPPPPPSPTP